MSWLWFLLALFIDSMINYPLLKWNQRRYNGHPVTFKEDGLTIVGCVVVHTLWALLLFILKKEYFWSNLLPMVGILLLN